MQYRPDCSWFEMIELRNISKSFNGIPVLEGINLEVEDREVLTIMGQSGAGKSVLIKIIIGLLAPDGGRIILDGVDITDYTEDQMNETVRTKIGMVYQYDALWDSMSIGDNLKLALRIKKDLSERDMDLKVRESLDMVELPDVQSQFPEELSGGMKKRIAVARAIIMKPKYIVYDEPTTGLDPVLTNTIDNLIVKLNKEQNITSLVISHDIRSAEKISDVVSMIHKGKIVHTCRAAELWSQHNDTFNKFIHGDSNFG